jgi:uncharacterized protein
MPEYLAPGVYVEEIDTGAKPIEGVSTSTAGMVGFTERGPVDVPILLTSYGDFTRWFGGRLPLDFRGLRFLPHAVEGFFTNGGKRLYLTRVVSSAALPAEAGLFRRDDVANISTALLRAEAEGSTSIYTLAPSPGSPVSVRVGDGSLAEYRQTTASAAAVPPNTHTALNLPLNLSHADGVANTVVDFNPVPLAGFPAITLTTATIAGATSITVTHTVPPLLPATLALIEGQVIEVGAEHRFVAAAQEVSPTDIRLTLRGGGLAMPHATTDPVTPLTNPPAGVSQLSSAAIAGDRLIFAAALGGNPLVAIGLLNDPAREIRRVGALGTLTLTQGAYAAYGAGSVTEHRALADVGGTIQLSAATVARSRVIAVNDRSTLAAGQVVHVGTEFVEIADIPSPTGSSPDPGSVVLAHGLAGAYPVGLGVLRQAAGTPVRPTSVAAMAVPAGASRLLVTEGTGYIVDDIICVNAPDGTRYYHSLSAAFAAATATNITLNSPLANAHPAGSPVVQCLPLMTAQALDVGDWGNRVRISATMEATGLVAATTLSVVTSATDIRLGSPAGVEAGTVLEFFDTGGTVGNPVKVSAITPHGRVTVQGAGLAPAQQVPGLGVRSREFRIEVRLLNRSDVARPSRNDQEIDREVFRFLSMDPRHSRYAPRVLGLIGGTRRRADHRPEGESQYVRLRDDAPTPAAQTTDLRVAPESLVDMLPNGQRRLARLPLTNGSDGLAAVATDAAADTVYIGADAPNPEQKTGLWTLTNLEDISIIAAPGRTSNTMQNELIAQCERMRYRVAVLDSPAPPGDAIADVQELRQRYDSKYAALYYPWLQIDDPFPTNLADINALAVPPSGHMVGIYARTDIERGVHKAPANEVVRGVTGLQRVINHAQQEVLNPYPSNINVIRDFRPNNRSIRVWGGRIITSDPDWKYVNVRRLLIFLERSIDLGLQWVVFEPNADPLWARVRRTISNFLTTVWRNGALEGTTKEEAFFVKCDRTTMTQADIDNGRLICVIGVAPVKPAEFVIVRIGLWTAHAED